METFLGIGKSEVQENQTFGNYPKKFSKNFTVLKRISLFYIRKETSHPLNISITINSNQTPLDKCRSLPMNRISSSKSPQTHLHDKNYLRKHLLPYSSGNIVGSLHPEYCESLWISLSISSTSASFKSYASWDNACVSNPHCVSLVAIVPSDISLRHSRELASPYSRWFAKQLWDLITRAFEFRRLMCHVAVRFQLESFKSSGGIVSYPLSEDLASRKNVHGSMKRIGEQGWIFLNRQRTNIPLNQISLKQIWFESRNMIYLYSFLVIDKQLSFREIYTYILFEHDWSHIFLISQHWTDVFKVSL